MKKVVSILLLLSVIVAAAGFFYIKNLIAPIDSKNTDYKMFVVGKGESFNSIANKLVSEGLIKSSLSLKIAAYQSNKGKNIQAGSFRLSPSMSPTQILDELAHGKLDIWMKIIEGWRREEIAENISKTFEDNNIAFDKNKFLNASKGKEGYLFPDTYLIPINTDESQVVSILETTLQKKLTAKMNADIKNSGHNFNEILTMASIIEREARTPETRKMIAGILWKRINNDWPLQADATLQYAKGFDRIEQTWWKTPVAADKDINSPYNTYKNVGLPHILDRRKTICLYS